MNGYNLLTEAARLIGLEQIEENLKIIGLPLVNSVISELGFCEISSLNSKIGISAPKVISALRFGTAALIANAIGDNDAKTLMEEKYRDLYTKVSSRIEKVQDVLPKGAY